MSNTNFVVALRLVGIWIVLTRGITVISVSISYVITSYDQIQPSALISIGVLLLWLVFGLALLIRPVAFGQLLVPGGVRGGGPTPWSINDFQTVAFKVIGLFLIVTAITSSDLLRIPIQIDFAIMAIAVKIAVGSLLLFRARCLVTFLDRADHTRKPDAAPSNK